jgi:hypothetical protein
MLWIRMMERDAMPGGCCDRLHAAYAAVIMDLRAKRDALDIAIKVYEAIAGYSTRPKSWRDMTPDELFAQTMSRGHAYVD